MAQWNLWFRISLISVWKDGERHPIWFSCVHLILSLEKSIKSDVRNMLCKGKNIPKISFSNDKEYIISMMYCQLRRVHTPPPVTLKEPGGINIGYLTQLCCWLLFVMTTRKKGRGTVIGFIQCLPAEPHQFKWKWYQNKKTLTWLTIWKTSLFFEKIWGPFCTGGDSVLVRFCDHADSAYLNGINK